MNIDNLVRTAVDKIKSNWGLPDKGFIAGGSISNLVWELVSGNKAVVNDIDVFIFDGAIDKIDTDDKTLLFRYQEKETKFWEDYTGMRFSSINKDFYTIVSSEHDGMFNKIKYKSNKVDTDLILRAFDINCTKVGYSIEEDKVYYDKDFEEFLQTGELKISNLMTPSHSVIRIVKKKKELNCNSEDLKEYFNIRRDQNSEQYVKINFGEDVNLYYLESIINSEVDNPFFGKQVFDDENIRQIYNSFEFIFYMRNIYNNKNLPEMWKKLYFFFNDVSYIDCKPTTEDLELISRLGFYAPDSIENLKGMKLSEQIKLVKSVLEKYEYDPIIAISILEKHKISEIELNEQNLLLLELSVRKKIVNDTRGKANKVLGIKEDLPINNPEWWR